ncbi:MAG: hypothetical protein HQM10_19160 [Candidatus Riflebacteria bacterium]|nr:hypothetical protein [Candidatus Riflebacteria bacterium]
MKKSEKIAQTLHYFLCIFFLFSILLSGCGGKNETEVQSDIASDTPLVSIESVAEKPPKSDIFERYHFPALHEDYQKTYLDLVKKINSIDSSKGLDIKQQKEIFKEYSFAAKKYQDAVEKISREQSGMKSKCFSTMKSLVLAVVFFDKKMNRKMFKFDSKRLVEAGIIKDEPLCPGNGEYSIFYKDGKRFLKCSVHGSLKQK